jgi:hypothetical protein
MLLPTPEDQPKPSLLKTHPLRWYHLVILGALIFSCSLYYLLNRYPMSDTASLGGDINEYQSISVNLIHGHGYKYGCIEDLSVYRFDIRGRSLAEIGSFVSAQRYSFYRTPGYPLFLAAIYKLVGIRPTVVKHTQAAMVAFVAALIPILSFLLWSRTGLLSGVLSSIVFLKLYSPRPDVLMSECLIVLCLTLWAFHSVYWSRRPTLRSTALIGVTSALLLLVKGVNLFIPFLFTVYMVYRLRESQTLKKIVAHLLLFYTAFTLTILPWSLYATAKSGSLVILSTQHKNVLLDGNNEDVIDLGSWQPAWRKEKKDDQRYLYNRLDGGRSTLEMLLIFLWENLRLLPRLFASKLIVAFHPPLTVLSIVMMAAYYLILFFRRRTAEHSPPIFPLIFFMNILLITLVLFGDLRFVGVFMFAIVLPACYLPFYSLKLVKKKVHQS